jgi:diguanylate cyclase (GGDEF)-like protein
MSQPDRRVKAGREDDALLRGLAEVDARLQRLVAATPLVVFVLDRDGTPSLWAGSGAERMSRDQLDLPAVRAAISLALAGHVATDVVHADPVPFALTVVPSADGGAVGAAYELSALRDASRRLAADAFVDRLTGLATRSHFLDRVEEARGRSRQTGLTVAVMFVDVDRFAAVNDSLGYAQGDRLLASAGDRIRKVLRQGDIAARVGGDEFAVLCEGVGGRDEPVAVAERIALALTPPFVLDGREVFVSASVGISLDWGEPVPAEDLLLDAAAAVRQARERGRGRWELFDQALRDAAVRRMETRSALYRALDRNELCLHYQPVVSSATRQPIGVEALVRWEHPDLGLVPPDQFVPVAEETGLIVPIGSWVLRHSCSQLADWQRRLSLPEGFRVSVNLSAAQLQEPALVGEVADVVADTGVGATSLTLEITESMLLEDAETLIATLRTLRTTGVSIAVDDFGTGWSALSYLKRLPLDVIKVDRSFVAGLLTVRADRAIADAVVGVARALDLDAVAEGVETAEQFEAVRDLGCTAAQGFYFSRPLPAEHVEALLVSTK